MEASGDYWKPFYYLLEDLSGVEVMLVNARHVKNLPGRKTDVADATWLAQLGAHGLVRGSFVPPEPIRQLRDLIRTRTGVTRERTPEIQRLEKLHEDAGIKLSSVAADLNGASSRAMLGALLDGETDPAAHGRPRQEADAGENPVADRSPLRSVHLPSRISDPHAPGLDRQAHRGHRAAHRSNRGGDGTLSRFPGLDLHHRTTPRVVGWHHPTQ